MNLPILLTMISRVVIAVALLFGWGSSFGQEEVYELRTYELEFFRPANVLHDYFEKALIPALNRQGVLNIGAFEEYGEGLPRKLYLLIPYKNIVAFQESKDFLEKDEKYLSDAENYLKAPEASIAFSAITTDLIRSSHGFPRLIKPKDDQAFFELRTYTSHNEDALRRKVKMFDDHEFPIFEEAGLSMVFFGRNIAGTQMPCLTYLLATKDLETNKAAWPKFIAHPEWRRIVKLDEYANNMNNILRIFLKPLAYSQL